MMKINIKPYYTIIINKDNGLVNIFSNSKHAKGRELSQYYTSDGYLRVKMNNKHYLIHQLVAKYCIGEKPDNLVINHKDGNKINNLPANLEYVTIGENIRHAIDNGLHVCCDPKKMPTYKDGRTSDIKKYKNTWYLQNRNRILAKVKKRYQTNLEAKEKDCSLIVR